MSTRLVAMTMVAGLLGGCGGGGGETDKAAATAPAGAAEAPPPAEPALDLVTIEPPPRLEEGAGNRTFSVEVMRFGALADWAHVRYAVTDLGATRDRDYRVRSAPELVFEPYQARRRIDVEVLGDALPEPDEAFRIDIVEAEGATVAFTSAVVTIGDDDAPVPMAPAATLSIMDAGANEHYGSTHPLLFAVVRGGDRSGPLTVNFSTVDGTAAASEDYEAQDGRLVFLPQQSVQWIEVRLRDDHRLEKNEHFYVRLGAVAGVEVLDAEAQATVVDEDYLPNPPPPQDSTQPLQNEFCETLLDDPTAEGSHCVAVMCATGEPIYWAHCPGTTELSALLGGSR